MNFAESISFCFSNYANFNGRGRRSEYWWFYLFTQILSLGGSVLDFTTTGHGYGVMYWITALVTIIPAIAAGARRLHDINKSGWWILLSITIIGLIPLVYWACLKGDEGDNRFGSNPLKN